MEAKHNPHRTTVGPPDGKATVRLAANAVHELRIANAIPIIARNEKFRSSSWLYPS